MKIRILLKKSWSLFVGGITDPHQNKMDANLSTELNMLSFEICVMSRYIYNIIYNNNIIILAEGPGVAREKQNLKKEFRKKKF